MTEQLDLSLEVKAKGDALKEAGIASVSENNTDWIAGAQAAITQMARDQTEVTADDLRSAVGPPPHSNCVGAAFNGLARAQILRRVGFRMACSPSAHARFISVWTAGPALNDL